MPFFINIVNMKTNGVSQVGSIDIGAAVHNSHTSNNKLIGVNFSVGDLSPTFSNMISAYFDPDIDDQGQVANPSAPITNQI
jgi:Spore germination protein gerPA/gerPF